MSDIVLDIQDALVDVSYGYSNETFTEIAKRLGVPVEWVEAEFEAMCEY